MVVSSILLFVQDKRVWAGLPGGGNKAFSTLGANTECPPLSPVAMGKTAWQVPEGVPFLLSYLSHHVPFLSIRFLLGVLELRNKAPGTERGRAQGWVIQESESSYH